MKIYVTHSRAFDFRKELYEPIRQSLLNRENEFVFPHERSDEPFSTREILADCDLVLAEVSFPSTGQGIELGWASSAGVKIVCIFRKGSKVSGSLKTVSSLFEEYSGAEDIVDCIQRAIS